MDPTEAAAIGVVGMTALWLTPDAPTRALLVVLVIIVAAVVNTASAQLPPCDRGYSAVSARRAAAADTRSDGKQPTYRNPPRVTSEASVNPPPSAPIGEPSTAPDAAGPSLDAAQPNLIEMQEDTKNMAATTGVDPYAFAYTNEAMQARREEFAFRPTPLKQSSESRARMLDNMYQELLDTSLKTDPGLRRVGTTGDGCEPMRGLVKPHRF
tara:strand:+ start:790 stop:1422 length:633 start_codon:yes stop_codon:yes gene_type:complete